MVIANFINKQDALVTGLDQYDYGQVLRIQGLKLPTAVEIHFGLEETGGTTTTRIGVTKDGVTDVPIPDSMLENGDTSLDYTIYAFIYLTDETSGKTVHRIKMQVKARSKPELLNKPEDKELFQKAIEAVNQSAKEAEGWAHGREDMPERAADNAKYYSEQASGSAKEVKKVEQSVKDMVATVDGIEQQVQDVKEYAGQAKTAAEKALLSEQEAKKSEGAALQHRTGAETAENNAELAESNAKKSEQAVEQAKQLVMQMGQEVLQNKNQVDGKVEEFNKTVKDASDAIETAKTDAVDAVETAGTEQTKKVSDEGAKQVKAVEGKGQEVLQSIPEDFTAQMESKLNKQQGVENAGKALVIGEDGNVAVGEVTGGDGIPIINTMSGESPMVVPDSAERVNKGFSLIGKSEQLTTTGKNLFDVTKVMDLKRYEPSSYGYIGFPINVEPGKTYTFNRNKKNGYGLGTKYNCGLKTDINGTIDNWLINNENEVLNFEKKTIVAKTDKIYFCILETVTDEELSTIIKTCFLNPQLELGNIETTYEPYTGGKASPSPEYPQEIRSVGKWNEEKQKYGVDVMVTGKNLIGEYNIFDAKNIDASGNIIDKPNACISDLIMVQKEQYYTLSLNNIDKTTVNAYLYDSDRKYIGYYFATASMTREFILKDDCFIRFVFAKPKAYILSTNIQLEMKKGSSPYEPQREPQTLTITSDRPITKWDKLLKKDGVWGWEYGSIVYSLTGSELFNGGGESYYSGKSTSMFFNPKVYDIKGLSGINDNAYLKDFKYVSAVWDEGNNQKCGFCFNGKEQFHLRIFNSDISISDDATRDEKVVAYKNYIKTRYTNGNPIQILGEAITPEFVPLSEQEQQALEALRTYYPTTVITTDGGEANPDIEVSYIADTKNYIDQKIAAIGKTVVETQKALL